MELSVCVVMLSDWHVGTGAGRYGTVDRAVQRDRSGLPYVPAKSLTGMWRDGCEVAAAALDGSGAGDGMWREWVEYLFGGQPVLEERGVVSGAGTWRPRAAALLVGAAHYPPEVAAALEGRPLLREAAVFLKPGVKVAPATGAAEPGMLRFEEMGRCGAVLSASAALPDFEALDAGQRRAVRALLAAGAGLVEQLGGKRRRGGGRCRWEIAGLEPDWEWLATGRDVPGPPPAAPARLGGRGGVAGTQREPAAGRWEVADLRLVLEQPVVAHERTVGNAVRSLDHVPGWMLLPAVLERLASDRAAACARRGHLVVTDATAEVGGRPGRPVPLALLHAKGDVADQRNVLAERPGPDFAGEPFAGGYVGVYEAGAAHAPDIRKQDTGAGAGAGVRVWCVGSSEHTHNTVDDAVQRPTERVGGLYTYQAIEQGTVLRAQVRVPCGVLPAGWERTLAGVWRVGRSRKDGYGRIRVEAVPAAVPQTRRPAVADGQLRVWLLSDVLLHDARLRPSTDPADLAAVLGRELGVRLALAQRPADGPEVQVSDVRRHDPWHRGWGLPRASLLGLSAGSCFRFDVLDGRPDPAAMVRVEVGGIGLRRAEGFGQVLIGDPLLSAPLAGAAPPAPPPPPSVPGSRAVPQTPATVPAPAGAPGQEQVSAGAGDTAGAGASLRAIVTAAWRREIHRAGEALAADPAARTRVLGAGHEKVTPSQFGALRTLLHQLSGPADPRAFAWLDALTATETRENTWPGTVRDQLRRLLTGPGTVWDLLALPEESLTPRNGSGGAAVRAAGLRHALWPEAVRTLVEDCLTAHARTTSRQEQA